jgi:preprotein translocase subunit SecD
MMLEYARWKYVVLVVILVIGTIYSLPNLYQHDPAILISANRGYQVDGEAQEQAQAALEQAKIAFKAIAIKDDRILVRLEFSDDQMRARAAIADKLGDGFVVALNLAPTVPTWLTAIGAKPMTLGLDLQGGIHVLLEVDHADALVKMRERLVDDVRTYLRERDIRYRGISANADGLLITLRSESDRDQAFGALSRDMPQFDLANGAESVDSYQLVGKIREAELRAERDKVLEQNISTLRNRMTPLGVTEPIIARQGESRIVVQLPGVQDTALITKLLGATATLEYRAVDERGSVAEALAGRVPPESRLYPLREGGHILLSKKIIASGDQLIGASNTFDERGLPAVSVTLNDAGGRRMLDFTNENVGNRMGVVFIETLPEIKVIDGKEVLTKRVKEEVINAAKVQEPFGKKFQTTGLDSPQEAHELALLLNAGALAAPVFIAEQRVVGPSLGRANIERGWTAVMFSFLFVLAFFVVYYKMFGLVANLALLLNLVLLVACMSIIGATLTLPGLAGIVLTVGMSVDANVLINERIREELRSGNSPLASIVAGYQKASGTIADANLTALLAGLALWVFGSGPIQGFAVALCVGIVTSMYTAVSVAHGITARVYGGRKVKRLAI